MDCQVVEISPRIQVLIETDYVVLIDGKTCKTFVLSNAEADAVEKARREMI